MVDLKAIDGPPLRSSAAAISDNGRVIVDQSTTPFGVQHAFCWPPAAAHGRP